MALTDFVLSTLSVIVIGGVFYAFSPMIRRAHAGITKPEVGAAA